MARFTGAPARVGVKVELVVRQGSLEQLSGSAGATIVNNAGRHVRERIASEDMWQIPGAPPGAARTHLISPEPFALSADQADVLQELGGALLAFYASANDLYLRDGPDWVRHYLDIGKPDEMLRHARMKYQKRALPAVIRPDILIAHHGLSITELDSVPGGIGQLDCLSGAYEDAGFQLVGSPRGMRDGFASILKQASSGDDPVCAIVVSDESIDYLPEMTYLGRELRKIGVAAHTVRPKEITFAEDGLFIEAEGSNLRVDVVYRFFELFDLLNIPKSELISYAARKRLVALTPPYKPFLEEKMLLALLHNESLTGFWTDSMGERNYALLKRTIAPTFILDNRPVPPHAQISGFTWQGNPLGDWREIARGTQKERRLVIKPSGFSPLAWGSRGVKVGQDMPQQDWAKAVETALEDFDSSPCVLQPFQDTELFGVEYHDESTGKTEEMQARVRLCPYYFVIDGCARLAGVLATACPKDKKLIHGMVDAVMAPCRLEQQ